MNQVEILLTSQFVEVKLKKKIKNCFVLFFGENCDKIDFHKSFATNSFCFGKVVLKLNPTFSQRLNRYNSLFHSFINRNSVKSCTKIWTILNFLRTWFSILSDNKWLTDSIAQKHTNSLCVCVCVSVYVCVCLLKCPNFWINSMKTLSEGVSHT